MKTSEDHRLGSRYFFDVVNAVITVVVHDVIDNVISGAIARYIIIQDYPLACS
jgi:hypothetical protein